MDVAGLAGWIISWEYLEKWLKLFTLRKRHFINSQAWNEPFGVYEISVTMQEDRLVSLPHSIQWFWSLNNGIHGHTQAKIIFQSRRFFFVFHVCHGQVTWWDGHPPEIGMFTYCIGYTSIIIYIYIYHKYIHIYIYVYIYISQIYTVYNACVYILYRFILIYVY